MATTTTQRTRGVPMMRSILVFLCLTLASLPDARAAFSVMVPAQKKECFRVRTPANTQTIVSGNYDILTDDVSGRLLDVWLQNLSIKDRHRSRLWQSTDDAREDTFTMTLDPNQLVELCFQSQWDVADADDDQLGQLQVGFGLRVHPIARSLPEEENGPDAERALKVVETAINVETEWSNLMDHFSFMRSREATYMRLTDEIMGRIMGWTIVEAVVVVTMAVAQVLYWRKFFEQKRYL